MSGDKIIEGLKEAIRGDLERVWIDGVCWTPERRWRDISTAPKDGTDILLARPGSVWIAYWKDGHERIGKYGARGWVPRDSPHDWWNYMDDPDYPIAWMPLPEPPEGT